MKGALTVKCKGPPGSILLLTLVLVIPLMLVVAGIAVDVGILFATRSELHRSMDAAALAGAGKLGFDGTVFPTVRLFAQSYAAANPYRYGGISLDLNTSNSASGDIVLGIWNGSTKTFTPSLDGTFVNAVLCRTTQSLPTYFLNMIGLTSLTTSAMSVAISAAPMLPPEGACAFPFAVSACPFVDSATYGSVGCGTMITFINNNVNTAGWVSVTGAATQDEANRLNVNANNTRNEVTAAYDTTMASGTCPFAAPPGGSWVKGQNGMDQSVYSPISNCDSHGLNCSGYFNTIYNTGTIHTVYAKDGTTKTYEGPGWEVYIPVVSDGNVPPTCPPGSFNQGLLVTSYARIIVAQVINGGYCGVSNNNPLPDGSIPPWSSMCPGPNGQSLNPPDTNLRAIFAFFDCKEWDSAPTPVPAPTASLADHLRLVQ